MDLFEMDMAWVSCPGTSLSFQTKSLVLKRASSCKRPKLVHRRHFGESTYHSTSLLHLSAQYRSPRPRGRREDDNTGASGGGSERRNSGDGDAFDREGDAQTRDRDSGASRGGGIFGSPVVVEEGNRLMRDHAELLRLGQKYKLFDREGKLAYIAQMESVFDRWKVFLKRFELSTDFQAQLYLKQLDTWLLQFGMQREDMLRNLEVSLDMMRQEAEREF